jgi:hypothetical protein
MYDLLCHSSFLLEISLGLLVILSSRFYGREGSEFVTTRNRAGAIAIKRETNILIALSTRSSQFLLSRADNHAENFFLAHDDEIFAVQLDLRTGVLAKQNVIALFNRQREHLALVIALATSNRDNFALRRLILSSVWDNDAASGGAYFFYAAD